MRTFSKLAISALALTTVFATTSAHAVSADASATVFTPAAISPTASGTDLNFGTFSGGTGGTVVLNPVTSAITSTGGVDLMVNGTFADFTITGDGGATYILTLSSNITLTSGSDTMAAALSHSASGTLSAGGVEEIQVGGTLAVAAAQPPGNYLGTYDVTVSY